MAFINHTKKFVFIANARCACTSMYKQLEKESEGDSIEWEGGLKAYPPQYHMSAKNVVKEFPETEKYFKFAFDLCNFNCSWGPCSWKFIHYKISC